MRRALAPLLSVWMLACAMPARVSTGRAETITRNRLDALRRNRARAIGFVNEGRLQRGDAPDPARVALLRRWIDDGLELGNHTFSHLDLHRVTLAEYEADLLRGEAITRDLLSRAGAAPRYFRHPYLHTGRDAETRRGLAAFLAEHGYRVAPVTIDNYDYLFAAAFDRADLGDDDANASPDEYYGPAGITWLHRWALTEGRTGSFFAGEPEVPGWIEEAAR